MTSEQIDALTSALVHQGGEVLELLGTDGLGKNADHILNPRLMGCEHIQGISG